MNSLFPAITILKSQAFDLVVQHHKVENPDNSVIEKHKYLIDSIDSAIKILETKHRKFIKKQSDMIGDPDNIEKMKAVYLAMRNINQIDRSDYFENYYKEVIGRINQTANHELEISYDENRSFEDLENIAKNYIESLK